jgi:hypothetical protein
MRLCAGLSRVEFALLARPRATSRATDSLYLFESGPLGLHGSFMMGQSGEEKWSILHSDIGWLLKHHYAQMGAFDLPEELPILPVASVLMPLYRGWMSIETFAPSETFK